MPGDCEGVNRFCAGVRLERAVMWELTVNPGGKQVNFWVKLQFLPVLQVWGFCTGLTTLSCKKAFVMETATCNLHESSVQKEPPESMPWAAVNAESENTRNSEGNRIRMTDSGQSKERSSL